MQDRNRSPSTEKTEASKDVTSARQQQHTGNHEREDRKEGRPYGADSFGGTRAGAENVEPKQGRGKHVSG
jgi:hypothetical protein